MDFIPTKASLLQAKASTEFLAVNFESYKPKSKRKDTPDKTTEVTVDHDDELNMKRARYEIIKFGMSGFDATKKEEAKVQLAIKLGAKPRRNRNINYKVLLEEKKKEKELQKTQVDFQQLGKNTIGKSTAKGKTFDRNRKKGTKSNILDIYGTVKKSDLEKTTMDKKRKRKY